MCVCVCVCVRVERATLCGQHAKHTGTRIQTGKTHPNAQTQTHLYTNTPTHTTVYTKLCACTHTHTHTHTHIRTHARTSNTQSIINPCDINVFWCAHRECWCVVCTLHEPQPRLLLFLLFFLMF